MLSRGCEAERRAKQEAGRILPTGASGNPGHRGSLAGISRLDRPGVRIGRPGMIQAEPVAILFGMPRWAFFGVVLPWMAAGAFTLWFSMVFMKDTDLDPDREDAKEGSKPQPR